MTQPQHCDHECVCVSYPDKYYGNSPPCDTSKGTRYKCPHDTRSRPHNSTPRPPCEECIYQAQSAEHDATVAKVERERFLKEILIVANGNPTIKISDIQDIHYTYVESLRSEP